MDYRDLIKKHEGLRNFVYLDTEGVPTVGWGHAFLGPEVPEVGDHYWLEECEEFFDNDMQQVEEDFVWLCQHYAFFRNLNWVRRAVIKNMLFNLGMRKFMLFKKMRAAICDQDWKTAAMEMLDSRWATQVGRRAVELAQLMRYGKWRLLD